MKTKFNSFNLDNALNRAEMKKIMAGSGGSGWKRYRCLTNTDVVLGNVCCSQGFRPLLCCQAQYPPASVYAHLGSC